MVEGYGSSTVERQVFPPIFILPILQEKLISLSLKKTGRKNIISPYKLFCDYHKLLINPLVEALERIFSSYSKKFHIPYRASNKISIFSQQK